MRLPRHDTKRMTLLFVYPRFYPNLIELLEPESLISRTYLEENINTSEYFV